MPNIQCWILDLMNKSWNRIRSHFHFSSYLLLRCSSFTSDPVPSGASFCVGFECWAFPSSTAPSRSKCTGQCPFYLLNYENKLYVIITTGLLCVFTAPQSAEGVPVPYGSEGALHVQPPPHEDFGRDADDRELVFVCVDRGSPAEPRQKHPGVCHHLHVRRTGL